MPGLYKSNKRKRPTLNSSQLNNTSIWHSTPLDSTEGGTTTGAEGRDKDRVPPSDDDDEILRLSPPKRTNVEDEVKSRYHGRIVASQSESSSQASSSADQPVLSSSSNRSARVVLQSSEDSDDMFADVERENVEHQFVQPQLPRSQRSSQQTLPRLHLSQRFGEVVINPPSGHTYFASVLHKNGFILTYPKNHIKDHAASFRKNLETWLGENNDEESRIENPTQKFLKALDAYLVCKENMQHALTTTLNDRETIQPSLLHCLLGVSFIQKRVLAVTFTFLAEASFGNTAEDADFVHTIMNQMKWLPVIVDGKDFAEKLMFVFEKATIRVQKQMVRFFAEIFPPEYHVCLVPKLMSIFEIGTPINVAMLDCFSCLVVPENDCLRIRHETAGQMANAPLDDLPAYFAYLLKVDCTLLQLEEGISEMRERLEIIAPPKGPKSLPIQVEILERIRFCVAVNPNVAKIWNAKIKDDLSCDLELKTLDLIMLLVFIEQGDKVAPKIMESILRKRNMVTKLFDTMIEKNKDITFELFRTLSKFIDSVVRQRDSKVHDAAIYIIKKLFVGLGPIKAQHLIQNLVSVLVMGHPVSRDVTLKVFTSIAETEPKKLLHFHTFLVGALVYVVKFPPRQMQALMSVLAQLAFIPETHVGHENPFTTEFMILLRKQISHPDIQTRRFGVLGTMSAVKQLALQNPPDEDKIEELLTLTWSSTEKEEESCSIFFDKLADIAHNLPKEIADTCRDLVKLKFETTWTLDQASESQFLRARVGQSGLHLEPLFDANKEMQRDQLVIVLEAETLKISPLVIPSHLRALAELEKAVENGALEGVDALIGSPIFFPEMTRYFERDDLSAFNYDQRTQLGQYLVIAINFFRECISAFCISDNPELRVKVWLRLNNVVTLQKLLVKHFDMFPTLPQAYGVTAITSSSKSGGPGFSGNVMPTKAKGKGKKPAQKKQPGAGKSKKGTNKKETHDATIGNAEGEDDNTKKKKKPGKKPNTKERREGTQADNEDEVVEDADESDDSIYEAEISLDLIDLKSVMQPKSVQLHVRHFDVNVFELLKQPLKISTEPIDFTGILLNLSCATQSMSTMQEVEKFTPESLGLLLIEVQQQLEELKENASIFKSENFLQALCGHIDSVSNWFQDGQRNLPDQPILSSCARLLLQTITMYFECIMIMTDKSKHDLLIGQAILTLATRYNSPSQSSVELDELPSQIELMANLSSYVCDFSKFVCESDSSTAEEHVKLLKTLHDAFPNNQPLKKPIGETIKQYLCKDWKLPSKTIDYFLRMWFATAASKFSIIKHLSKRLLTKSSEEDSIPNCTVYKTCTKANFHTWYSALINGLAQHVHKNGRRRGDFEDSIGLWGDSIEVFNNLVLISHELKSQNFLTPLLKHSRVYIEAFISGGACLLPELWSRDPNGGMLFTKPLQLATRRIQNICEHSKIIQSNQLMRFVPLMKKTLETLVFRVREALANYGVAKAFWMGPLKIRNLDGKEIDSQPFRELDDSDDSNAEDDDEDQRSSPTNETEDNENDDENDDASGTEESSSLKLSEEEDSD